MSKTKKQFMKFAIVGLCSTFYNYIIYSILYLLLNQIIFASVVGYTVGLLNSYLFGKKWVFKVKSSNNKRLILNFLVVYAIGALVSSTIIYFINSLYNDYSLAWLAGTIFAVMINFLGSKYIVFTGE